MQQPMEPQIDSTIPSGLLLNKNTTPSQEMASNEDEEEDDKAVSSVTSPAPDGFYNRLLCFPIYCLNSNRKYHPMPDRELCLIPLLLRKFYSTKFDQKRYCMFSCIVCH